MHSTYRRGFLLRDAAVLLFMGSVAITAMLNLFSFSYRTEESIRMFISERDDFLSVSGRIKTDLQKDVLDFTENPKGFTYHYLYSENDFDYKVKSYTLYFTGRDLIYQSETGKNFLLSNLIKEIKVTRTGNVITINFRYEENTFSRSIAVNEKK